MHINVDKYCYKYLSLLNHDSICSCTRALLGFTLFHNFYVFRCSSLYLSLLPRRFNAVFLRMCTHWQRNDNVNGSKLRQTRHLERAFLFNPHFQLPNTPTVDFHVVSNINISLHLSLPTGAVVFAFAIKIEH